MSGQRNRSKSKPVVLELTEADLALQDLALRTGEQQFNAFNQAVDFAGGLSGAIQGAGTFEALAGQAGRVSEDPLSQAILQQEQARVQGGGATPEQIARIQGVASSNLGIARSDINDFAQSQRDSLIQDLTPSLGLRPGDTPIQDRGFQIGSEATRQFGQASRQVQGQAFQAELDLPLAESGRNAALLGLQGQLAQQSFNQRAELAGLGASALGSLTAPAPISSLVSAVKAPKVAGTQSKSRSTGGGVF